MICFNSSSYERTEIVPFVIDIPIEYDKGSLKIFDLSDKEMEVQISKTENVQPVLEQMIDRPMFVDVKRYFGYLELKSIPPVGYKTFKIIPSDQKPKNEKIAKYNRGKLVLENEHLKNFKLTQTAHSTC